MVISNTQIENEFKGINDKKKYWKNLPQEMLVTLNMLLKVNHKSFQKINNEQRTKIYFWTRLSAARKVALLRSLCFRGLDSFEFRLNDDNSRILATDESWTNVPLIAYVLEVDLLDLLQFDKPCILSTNFSSTNFTLRLLLLLELKWEWWLVQPSLVWQF